MLKKNNKNLIKVVDKPTISKLIFGISIILLISYSSIAFTYYTTRTTTLIVTKLGKLSGITVKRLGKDINCYFGIPYAEPPVGDLRFRKPVPKKKWTGLLKAQKMPNQCMQMSLDSLPQYECFKNLTNVYYESIPESVSNIYANPVVSEDCLYLNIFMSADTTVKSNLTVMLFIHGGSFMGGSNNFILYDGSVIAALSQVIVITINYRLGIFGFLAANHSELEGNYGLHDQVMALQWVQNNINAFGGNPRNVVIFGESTGGVSVGYHLISPLSKNLFKRAILQSNGAINWSPDWRQFSNKVGFNAIRDISCLIPVKNDQNSSQEITASSLTCLRQVNASELLDLQLDSVLKKMLFLPTEDHDFFGGNPFDLVKEQKFIGKRDIIIGSNSDELTIASKYGPLGKFWSNDQISPNFTKENILKTIEESTPEAFGYLIPQVIDFMFEGIDDNDSVKLWNRYTQLFTDIGFVCPNYMFINDYSSFGAKVYYYEFNIRSSLDKWSPKWLNGALHGSELMYVFGVPLLASNLFKPQEIQFSKTIIKTWTQFAINGFAEFGNDSWLQYTEETPHYMSINLGNITLKDGFPGFKCDQYFEQLFNGVRSQVSNNMDNNDLMQNLEINFDPSNFYNTNCSLM